MVTAETISTIGWTMGKVALSTVGGGILGGTLFGIAGGYVGFNAGKSNDPCKDGQMITTLAGTGIGAYFGVYIGGAMGLTGAAGGINLLSTPFKSIVNGVANIVGNHGKQDILYWIYRKRCFIRSIAFRKHSCHSSKICYYL